MSRSYHQECVGVEKLVYLDERAELQVPGLEFPNDPAELPATILRFFQALWYEHGYAPIKSPHEAAIALPSHGDVPPTLLGNRYSGLTDGQVLDRQPYLTEYKRQREKREQMTYSTRGDEARGQQDKKLKAILEHIPDYNGIQGIASYVITLPRNRHTPFSSQIRRSEHTALLNIHYGLGNERDTYNLPKGDQKTPSYPTMSAEAMHLFVGDEAYQPDLAGRDESYRQHWQELTGLIRPLLLGTAFKI